MEDKNSRFDVNYKDDIKSVDTIDGLIDHKDYDHKDYDHKVYNHKVSICIPVYNNPDGLKKLIESIKSQTFKDYEVIVSDDSDAGHAELCKEITLNYSEHMTIRYIRHKSTGKPGDNWNSSISDASGEYIKMMFHDDWFTDRLSLGRFVELIDNSKAQCAFSGSIQVSDDWRYARHIKTDDLEIIQKDIRNLYVGNVIGAPSATIFRNKGIHFDNRLRWLIDMDYYLAAMIDEKDTIINTDEPLVSIGISDSQLTNYCRQHPGIVRREYLYVGRKYGLLGNTEYRKYLVSQLKKPH